jgi:hypothetical protein
MVTKTPHTAELVNFTLTLPELINAVEVDITNVMKGMVILKKAGLIYATEYWRKDSDGEPKYLYLLHQQKQGELRKREYIGRDIARIEEVRAGIARAKEYDELAVRLANLKSRIRYVAGLLSEVTHQLSTRV